MIQKAVPGLAQVYIECVNKGRVMSLEDGIMEIYKEVESKGLRKQFDKQLAKMKSQSKHNHKTANELWDYALMRVKGWNPNKSKK